MGKHGKERWTRVDWWRQSCRFKDLDIPSVELSLASPRWYTIYFESKLRFSKYVVIRHGDWDES